MGKEKKTLQHHLVGCHRVVGFARNVRLLASGMLCLIAEMVTKVEVEVPASSCGHLSLITRVWSFNANKIRVASVLLFVVRY
jgi:hypothetical protein